MRFSEVPGPLAARLIVAVIAAFVPLLGLRASEPDAVALARGSFYWFDGSWAVARSLGRGINLGNMLDAPREGDWGPTLRDEYFHSAQEAGFNAVRLPVRWSNHALPHAPYNIDEALFRRVDSAIAQAVKRGLRIVVNMHHHRQLDGDPLDPNEQRVDDSVLEERFVAMWRQIAERYRTVDTDKLLFELYNEPHNRLTSQRWNTLLRNALDAVRSVTPERYVVIGPVERNKVEYLSQLSLPVQDRRIIVTVHLYEPYEFTHQGATWVPGSKAWLNTDCCTVEQAAEFTGRLDIAAGWSKRHMRPIWVGEFGTHELADYGARVRYARRMREAIEVQGFTWAYWSLLGEFGILTATTNAWRAELKDALLDGKTGKGSSRSAL
jgi:endoglucanase